MAALSLPLLLVRLVFGQEVWNLIDVASVVCPGGPGATSILIKEFEIGSNTAVAATFFRASPQPVSLRFGITDANGIVVVEPIDVTLQDMSPPMVQPASQFTPQPWSRRLNAGDTLQFAETDVSLCEKLFLMDGRLPLDLPDTWGEARKAFREVCADVVVAEESCSDVEQRMFGGSFEDHPFVVDGAFCGELVERTSRLVGDGIGIGFLPVRRLKGYEYVERPSIVAARFQPGYMTTPYGYSGVRVGGLPAHIYYYPFFFHTPYYSRYHTYPQDRTACVDSECVSDFVPPDGFTRDDLPGTAFSTRDYQLPLTVSFFRFNGSKLDPTVVCPPLPPGNWQPPPGSDIFFAFAAIDEEQNPWWYYIATGVACCFMCYCFGTCASKTKSDVGEEEIPLQSLTPAPSASCPGGILCAGDRVETRWGQDEGGDGMWYRGVVHSTYEGNMVHIKYEDGTSWTGEATEVHKLL